MLRAQIHVCHKPVRLGAKGKGSPVALGDGADVHLKRLAYKDIARVSAGCGGTKRLASKKTPSPTFDDGQCCLTEVHAELRPVQRARQGIAGP